MSKSRHNNNGLRKICGCSRRTWAKCDHSWHFSFKWRDVHYRFSLDRHVGKHIDNKTDAETEAENLRVAIKKGEFGRPAPRDDMTLRQFADVYLERYAKVEKRGRFAAFDLAMNSVCDTAVTLPTGGDEALGKWRLADIVTDSIERFREARRAMGTGVVGTNRLLGSLRAALNWGIRTGYIEASPFKRGTEVVVRLSDEPSRSRRLDADTDEGDRLLAACGSHLRAVVECALETGMRRGEILSLQWKQVEGQKVEEGAVVWSPRAELVLPWTKTKTRTDRRIPISTRLKAILEMRRFDSAGEPHDAVAYVFGNEIGQRVKDIGRAWETSVLKAHDRTPAYTDTANLTPASRAALAAIDLHFHDLRREAGSRWIEGGVPLHDVKEWLGHSNISQTSTYLASTMRTRHDSMRQFEMRIGRLQPLATGSEIGGRKRTRTAKRADRKPNKTTVGHATTTM